MSAFKLKCTDFVTQDCLIGSIAGSVPASLTSTRGIVNCLVGNVANTSVDHNSVQVAIDAGCLFIRVVDGATGGQVPGYFESAFTVPVGSTVFIYLDPGVDWTFDLFALGNKPVDMSGGNLVIIGGSSTFPTSTASLVVDASGTIREWATTSASSQLFLQNLTLSVSDRSSFPSTDPLGALTFETGVVSVTDDSGLAPVFDLTAGAATYTFQGVTFQGTSAGTGKILWNDVVTTSTLSITDCRLGGSWRSTGPSLQVSGGIGVGGSIQVNGFRISGTSALSLSIGGGDIGQIFIDEMQDLEDTAFNNNISLTGGAIVTNSYFGAVIMTGDNNMLSDSVAMGTISVRSGSGHLLANNNFRNGLAIADLTLDVSDVIIVGNDIISTLFGLGIGIVAAASARDLLIDSNFIDGPLITLNNCDRVQLNNNHLRTTVDVLIASLPNTTATETIFSNNIVEAGLSIANGATPLPPTGGNAARSTIIGNRITGAVTIAQDGGNADDIRVVGNYMASTVGIIPTPVIDVPSADRVIFNNNTVEGIFECNGPQSNVCNNIFRDDVLMGSTLVFGGGMQFCDNQVSGTFTGGQADLTVKGNTLPSTTTIGAAAAFLTPNLIFAHNRVGGDLDLNGNNASIDGNEVIAGMAVGISQPSTGYSVSNNYVAGGISALGQGSVIDGNISGGPVSLGATGDSSNSVLSNNIISDRVSIAFLPTGTPVGALAIECIISGNYIFGLTVIGDVVNIGGARRNTITGNRFLGTLSLDQASESVFVGNTATSVTAAITVADNLTIGCNRFTGGGAGLTLSNAVASNLDCVVIGNNFGPASFSYAGGLGGPTDPLMIGNVGLGNAALGGLGVNPQGVSLVGTNQFP